jgi:ankyrin repeat protein
MPSRLHTLRLSSLAEAALRDESRNTSAICVLLQARSAALCDAIKHKAPLAVLQEVLDARPEAARAADKDGDLPLHCAVLYKAPLEVVRAILSV